MGFTGVEYPYPYQVPIRSSQRQLRDNGLEVAIVTAPVGDWKNGERGMAALTGREEEFLGTVEQGVEYALALGCGSIHVMSGFLPARADRRQAGKTMAENLTRAADICAKNGLNVVIEPINNIEQPGYFMNDLKTALDILEATGKDNIFLLYDIYHGAMNGEDMNTVLRWHIDHVAHFQIAGYPGRNEPAPSEIDYEKIFETLDHLDYRGWIGCEYNPRHGTVAGLRWAEKYGIAGN